MEIAVGIVKQIIEVALAIKVAVDTAKQNKEVCLQIGKRVKRLSAILMSLGNSEMMKHPTMRDTLQDLEVTLRHAYELIEACQEKHIISQFLTAKNLSKQLRQVNQDIMDQMAIANFGSNVQISITINTKQAASDQPHSKDEEHEESSDSSHSADHTRSELIDKQKNAEASISDAAPLPSCSNKFNLSLLESATNNFSDDRVIGRGGFATVYKGVLPNGLVIAVKKFREPHGKYEETCRGYEAAIKRLGGPHGEQHLAQYINVFSRLLKHENVVRFLGCYHEDRRQLLLVNDMIQLAGETHTLVVEEYMPFGAFSKIMGSLRRLDWSIRFRIIRGIAHGIAYIHSKNIVHLDLKPANVLLDYDLTPKICDFEISRVLDQEASETVADEIVGTMGYMPPEYLADGIISKKNDIFSFGILVLHTIKGMSRSKHYQDTYGGGMCMSGLGKYITEISTSRHFSGLSDWACEVEETQNMKKLFDPSLFHGPQIKEIERCFNIAVLCVEIDRKHRPTMPGIIEMLDGKRSCER